MQITQILNRNGSLSASQIHRKFKNYTLTPLTSIRRELSNMKKAGIVEPTGTRIKGIYSATETVYRMVSIETQQTLEL